MTQIIPIKCGMVTCWLLRGESGAALVDTGVPKYRKTLLSAIAGEPLTLIFLTHGHADNIGNAAFLAETTGAKTAMHEADADLISRPHGHTLTAKTFMGKLLKTGTDASMYKPQEFVPDLYFKGGEKLDAFGIDAQVTTLPGHTSGSMGVLVNRTEFIVGDAVSNMFSPAFPLMFEDGAAAADSLKKIRLCRPAKVYPAHGKPFSGSEMARLSKPENF